MQAISATLKLVSVASTSQFRWTTYISNQTALQPSLIPFRKFLLAHQGPYHAPLFCNLAYTQPLLVMQSSCITKSKCSNPWKSEWQHIARGKYYNHCFAARNSKLPLLNE